MSYRVGIIIVSYNQKIFINRLFQSLSNQSFTDFCIYFIDNCSQDDSADYARKLCGNLNFEVKFYELQENTGYSGGNNYGVKQAVYDGCKYCLILNTDTELDRECIKSLIEC